MQLKNVIKYQTVQCNVVNICVKAVEASLFKSQKTGVHFSSMCVLHTQKAPTCFSHSIKRFFGGLLLLISGNCARLTTEPWVNQKQDFSAKTARPLDFSSAVLTDGFKLSQYFSEGKRDAPSAFVKGWGIITASLWVYESKVISTNTVQKERNKTGCSEKCVKIPTRLLADITWPPDTQKV